MLVTGQMFIGLSHIFFMLHSVFANTVDYDMGMNVTGVVMSICMCNNKCLKSRKVFLGKFE